LRRKGDNGIRGGREITRNESFEKGGTRPWEREEGGSVRGLRKEGVEPRGRRGRGSGRRVHHGLRSGRKKRGILTYRDWFTTHQSSAFEEEAVPKDHPGKAWIREEKEGLSGVISIGEEKGSIQGNNLKSRAAGLLKTGVIEEGKEL